MLSGFNWKRVTLRLLATSSFVNCNEALRIGLADTLYDGNEKESDALEIGRQYLLPFFEQKYYGSVLDIKRMITSPRKRNCYFHRKMVW